MKAISWRTLRRYQRHYSRWLDAAGLSLLLTTALAAAYAAYRWFGQDFRGYYAAARLVLRGSNPYDYTQLAQVLFELDGRVGNNPFYYAPWWALFFTPLAAVVPYDLARAVWLGFNLIMGGGALVLSQRVLDWRIRGGARWLVYWSALFLLGWMCLRYEQSGIYLFAVLALVLWSLRQEREWLAGLALPLLLTKPNTTFFPVAVLVAMLWFRERRRVLLWAGLGLTILLLCSTLAMPGWYEPILRGELPNGLTQVLDGPHQVVAVRINTTLLDWLNGLGLQRAAAWVAWGAVTLVSLGLLAWAWRRGDEMVYLVALAEALGFLVTPYALQYDYPPMALGLLWIYRQLPQVSVWQRGIALAVLAFLFSVLFWERPISDGYWLALGLSGLLVWLSWPRDKHTV